MRIPKSAGFDAEIGLLQIAKLGSEEIGRKNEINVARIIPIRESILAEFQPL